MTAGPAARRRAQRKQDLLAASALVRTLVVDATDEIDRRVAHTVYLVALVREVGSDPHVRLFGRTLGSWLVLRVLRRVPALRWLRWGMLGWRVWQAVPWSETGRPAVRSARR